MSGKRRHQTAGRENTSGHTASLDKCMGRLFIHAHRMFVEEHVCVGV